MANVPLLRKVVEWAEAQSVLAESKWFQGSWFRQEVKLAKQDLTDPMCGTSMCLAGYAAHLDGWMPVLESTEDGIYQQANQAHKDGVFQNYEAIGAELLDLTYGEGERLFAGYNTVVEIREIAEAIAGERL